MARHAQVAGLAGFLCLRTLADLRGPVGLIAIGLPAGADAVRLGSGPLNCARHPGESWDLFLIMQTVTRSTSGISALQSRNASGLQACCCSSV